jgi:16S rRNA (uracil1498-N3)-methyltransferase
MRLHRFFLPSPIEGASQIAVETPELLHQWSAVFRYRVGDKLLVLDGSGSECEASFLELSRKGALLSIERCLLKPFAPKRIVHLYFSLIKKDTMEWILEKGTELGVTTFHPIVSERSEKKGFNAERAGKIVREACEQSGRSTLPEIAPPLPIEQALRSVRGQVYTFHGPGETPGLTGAEAAELSIFIGPEGGWSEADLAALRAAQASFISLGSQTLRAETAAVAAAALLLL